MARPRPHGRASATSAERVGHAADAVVALDRTAGARVAFLLSSLLVLFGLWIRLRLEETPVFQAIKEKGVQPEAPIREVFREQTRPLVAAVLSRVAPDVTYAMFTVFVLTYATKRLGMTRESAQTAVLIGSGLQIFLMPLAGALSDRVNRRKLYLVAAIAAGVWPLIFFPLVGSGSLTWLIAGVVVALVIHAAMYGPQAAFIVEQFTPRLRSTGASLAYTIAGVIGGGVAPLIFTLLLARTGGWPALAGYLAVTAVVTVIGLSLGRDPDLREETVIAEDDRPAAVRP
ncbi:MAG: MFS transporter [Actinoallomurus sp.]